MRAALSAAVAAAGAAVLATASLSASAAAQEQLAASGRRAPAAARRAERAAFAVRADRTPVLDGRDGDEVWRTAPRIAGFRQFDPVEDGEPAFRTEARIAYDDRHLYVLVRAFDPHPDSIVALLSRRDVRTPSDHIKVMVDSYHDRRTGYEFAVNPAGVKRDIYTFNDGEEDESWDAVWDVATAVDSAGWTAEFRIPFSQLRFAQGEEHVFGIMISRDVARLNQRDSWPLYRRSRAGIASQFAEVGGFRGIPTPRRLEIAPYTVASSSSVPVKSGAGALDGYRSTQRVTGGADLKLGLTSNLTLDATINPDFGQVEADPAVLNLTAFESFFQEKRPFFLEGTGIFRFDVSCNDGTCNGLFYSRRVGRNPQLNGMWDDANARSYGDETTNHPASIVGAAKLTGRLAGGTSIGLLNAVTRREEGLFDVTVEPRTNYLVGRVQQDFRRGKSGLGAMVTAVKRDNDRWTSPFLRDEAYTGGVDFRHRFGGDAYQLTGFVAGSRVRGSPDAILSTQRSSARYFQRPGDDLALDPARRALAGDAEQVSFGKVGGKLTRFNTSYSRFSPGFEINDVGFNPRADQQSLSNWFALVSNYPAHFWRSAQLNFNQWTSYSVSRDSLARGPLRTGFGGNVNAHAGFRNNWDAHAGVNVSDFIPVYCDRGCTRGGPAVRTPTEVGGWAGINGDSRKAVTPSLWFNLGRGDAGHSFWVGFDPSVDLRASSRFSMSVGPSFSRNVTDNQFVSSVAVGNAAQGYVSGHMDQRTAALTTRINYTATPTLSLQVYAQPFISSGHFTQYKELSATPRAARYEDRYRRFGADAYLPPSAVDEALVAQYGERARYVDRDGVGGPELVFYPQDFNSKSFNSNVIMRWEYRAGSVLYVVWTQGRDDQRDAGLFRAGRDFRTLFGAHPDNTFLVKASYWFNP